MSAIIFTLPGVVIGPEFREPLPWARPKSRGVVHVWASDEGGFEIGHESATGNSWGHFDRFGQPSDAIAAAHALNRDKLDGLAEVSINPDVVSALATPASPEQGEF